MAKNVKLSSVVPAQLPAHIRQDYATFEAFMKAYYEYLDQQQLTRNLEFLRDVDKTLDVFVSELKDELAVLAPNLAKDRFFLKHAKEMYVSRGSEESYKFLFRLLYNKDVETVQLNDKMLKASGGNWQQDVSFFLKLESGNISAIENNYLRINSKTESGFLEKHERVFVLKAQKVEFVENVYEVFINRQYFGKLQPGDTVSDLGIKGTIIPTTTSVNIVNPGSGFRVGQIFNISTSLGTGLQLKVINIDRATGGLKALQIIGFGVGFEQSFEYNFTRMMAQQGSQTIGLNAEAIAGGYDHKVGQTDVLNNGKDYGQVTRQSFHEDYVDGDYVGEVLADFYSNAIPQEVETTVATIKVNLGALAVYPGFYRNSQSLLDDDSYIQDGYYYQDFSYLIRIDEKISTYRDVVASTLHPVGRKMFGDFLIESTYDFTYELFNPIIRLFFPLVGDEEKVSLVDKVLGVTTTKVFTTDGVGRVYDYYDDAEIDNHFVLHVRVGQPLAETVEDFPILGTEHYTVDYQAGTVTLDAPPLAGKKVSITYAMYSTAGSSKDHQIIFDKVLEDATPPATDQWRMGPFFKNLTPEAGYNDAVTLADPTRVNVVGKSFPSEEILLNPASTSNEKDAFVVSDTDPTKGFSKRLAVLDAGVLVARSEDTLIASDTATSSMSKPLSDTATSTDAISEKVLLKNFHPDYGNNEIVTTSEVTTSSMSKPLSEAITLSSTPAFEFVPAAFIDTVASTDTSNVETGKGITDSFTPSDASPSFGFDKYINDEVIVVDTASLLFQPQNFADQVVLSDDYKVTNADGAYLSQATITEQLGFSLERQFDETTTVNTSAWVQLNPYSSEAYFPNGYQDGGTPANL